MHDGFAADVEAGVDQDRAAGAFFEGFEDGVEARGAVAADGLHAGGVVHVRDRGQFAALRFEFGQTGELFFFR